MKTKAAGKEGRARRIFKRVQRVSGTPGLHYLLPLRGGEELPICGVIDVCVLRGNIEVWGARLAPSSKLHRIVAPSFHSLPCIRALRLKEGRCEVAVHQENSDIQAFLEAHQWPVVLGLRLDEGLAGSGDAELFEALQAILQPPAGLPRLRAHPTWPSLVDRFCDTLLPSTDEQPPVLMVTGPRNVGKSSCCRYLVNAMLSKTGEACFLETDIGQPELTPPGLVSLHHISAPLLQATPAGSGSNKCVASYFAGSVTPAVHPKLYTQCVRAAFDAYLEFRRGRASSSPLPLIVNTHGWNAGLGLELVRVIHAAVRPQLVIRIFDSSQVDQKAAAAEDWAGANPAKRRRSMLNRCGPLAHSLEAMAGVRGEEESQASVLVDVQQVSRQKAAIPGRKVTKGASTAPELRWKRFALHFRQDLDPCTPPTSMCLRHFFAPLPRVRLCLQRVRFGLIPGNLWPSEVAATFTGTVVALCCLVEGGGPDPKPLQVAEKEASAENGSAGNLPKPSGVELEPAVLNLEGRLAQCLSFAFVHSFDFAQGDVIVYPADPQAPLEKVEAVLRGDITWEPHSIRGQQVAGELLDSMAVSPLQPYCSPWLLEGLAAGARTRSMRPHLLSKRKFGAGPQG